MATSTGNVYLDPSYSDGINGSTHGITGEVLEFGINAFNNQAQANNALVTGGTIFVTNWGTVGLQGDNIRPGKPASIVAQGPTYFSVVYGGNPTTIDDDVTIVVENQGTPQQKM